MRSIIFVYLRHDVAFVQRMYDLFRYERLDDVNTEQTLHAYESHTVYCQHFFSRFIERAACNQRQTKIVAF